jgi:MFS family permease
MSGPASRLALIGLGTLIVPLDSAVNIAFPAITDGFGGAITRIQWVIIAYVLTYGSLMLAIGRIGDVFGHLLVFRAGLAWSVVAFLLCAAAPSFEWLLACRIAQGIGAALVISCGAALATGLYPESARARVLGIYAFGFAAGSVIGPSLGGLLVERFGWPAVFWSRAPIALAALLLLRDIVTPPRPGAREPFDAPGALLLALTIAALLLAVNQARHLVTGGWLAAVLGAVALTAGAGFLWWSRRVVRPVIALRHLRAPTIAFGAMAALVANFAAFAVLLLVPFWLARMEAMPTTAAGLVLATGPLGTMLASPAAGWLLGRAAPPRLIAVGMVALAAGLALVAFWTPATPPALMAATLLLSGVGLGLVQVSGMEMVTGAMPPADRGVAGSLAMLARTLGIVMAASLLSLMFAAEEAAALATGAAPVAAFEAAFAASFLAAAAAPAGFLTFILARSMRALHRSRPR